MAKDVLKMSKDALKIEKLSVWIGAEAVLGAIAIGDTGSDRDAGADGRALSNQSVGILLTKEPSTTMVPNPGG